jgi:hypothetical protein
MRGTVLPKSLTTSQGLLHEFIPWQNSCWASFNFSTVFVWPKRHVRTTLLNFHRLYFRTNNITNIIMCLRTRIQAPRHEDVLGIWRYSSTVLNFGTRCRWEVSFASLPFYSRENSPQFPSCVKLSRPYSLCELRENLWILPDSSVVEPITQSQRRLSYHSSKEEGYFD